MAASSKRDVIRIRVPAETKALLVRAVAARGQALSKFVIGSARREAEETLFGQPPVLTGESAFGALLDMLDNLAPLSYDLERK